MEETYNPPAATQQRIPWRIGIAAVLFIAEGIGAASNMAAALPLWTFFDVNILGLLVGPGLLCLSAWWRKCALVQLWINLSVLGIVAFTSVFQGRYSGTSAALGAGVLVAVIWTYRLLTGPDVRALFAHRGTIFLRAEATAALVLGVAAALATASYQRYNGHWRGWSSAAGYYMAINRDQAVFEKRLDDWLAANSFIPAESPGGMTAWAGVHTDHAEDRWYRPAMEDPLKPHMIRVQIRRVRAHPDDTPWLTQFDFSHVWEARGTQKHVDEMYDLGSLEYFHKFHDWMVEACKESERSQTSGCRNDH